MHFLGSDLIRKLNLIFCSQIAVNAVQLSVFFLAAPLTGDEVGDMHWGTAVSIVYIASLKYGKPDWICRIRHGVDPKRL